MATFAITRVQAPVANSCKAWLATGEMCTRQSSESRTCRRAVWLETSSSITRMSIFSAGLSDGLSELSKLSIGVFHWSCPWGCACDNYSPRAIRASRQLFRRDSDRSTNGREVRHGEQRAKIYVDKA